jgi:hypothetical protein
MTLAQLAQEALQNLHIDMRPIIPCAYPDWNVGELALAHVRITNATGAPLRNIDVETYLFGSAAEYVSGPGWDGNGAFRQSLEMGEVWQCYPALLRGAAVGTFQLAVFAAAEVVPFGTTSFSLAEYSVLLPPGPPGSQ